MTDEAVEVPLAGLLDRFLAYALDGLFILFCAFLSLKLALARHWVTYAAYRRWMLGWMGVFVLYHAVLNAGGRATPGKRLVGVRVLTTAGDPPGFGRSLVRALGYLVGAAPFELGFIWAFLHSERRAWHDLLAGTVVVESREKSPAGRTATSLASAALLVVCVALGLRERFAGSAAAERSAREGLAAVARLEESYHARHGTYTDDLKVLVADAGESPARAGAYLRERLASDGFGIQAGKDACLILGRARDPRGTEVRLKIPAGK